MKITEQSIRQACDLLCKTLLQKNHDYGNSVEEQFREYGESSLHIRCDGKIRRLKQLHISKAKVKTEKKSETALDLAGYALLGHILLSSPGEGEEYQKTIEKFHKKVDELKVKYSDQDDQY
jgi:hypothetical protein